MLKPTERMQRLLTANEKQLAAIDRVLEGDTTTSERKANTETCTYQEAARRLHVSRPSIYRLAREGRLTIVPLCGVNRILVQSIEDLCTGTRKADQDAAVTVREMGKQRAARRAATIANRNGDAQ